MRNRLPEPLDPLWYVAFPIYYLVMTAYGAFAAYYFLPSVAATNGPRNAQTFGIAIAVVCAIAFAGCLRSIYRQRPLLEMCTTIIVVVLMVTYTVSIALAIYAGNDGTRPGSIFVPILFAVFPAMRVAVIIRSGRIGSERQ